VEVRNKVMLIISEHFGMKLSEVTIDKKLADDLGADSLDAVDLTMAFEEEFEIEIPDEDMEVIAGWTVGQVVARIQELDQ
jgi:acyl carrier protein